MTDRLPGFRTDHDADAVGAVIAAADDAFAEWRNRAPADRAASLRRAADLLVERADELADLIRVEMGKLPAEGRGEVSSPSTPSPTTPRPPNSCSPTSR